MGDLSKNFSRREFKCKGMDCCGGSAPVDGRLVIALEELRTKVGNKEVHINSGYRCLVWNRVPMNEGGPGSNDNSQHPKGYAADIRRIPGMSIDEMAAIAEEIEAFRRGGIGRYHTFIHLDVRKGRTRWDERT